MVAGEDRLTMDMSSLSDWDVKKIEAENIEKMVAEKDVAGLVDFLRHGSRVRPSLNRELRWLAARALGRLRDARALEPLTEALQDEDSGLRGSAANALGEIGDPRAVEYLIKALEDKDDYPVKHAAEALGKLGDVAVVEHLVPFLRHDPRSEITQAAAKSLEKLGWKAKDDEEKAYFLLAKWDWEGLAKLGKAAVPPLIWAMEIDTKSLRQQAAMTLGKIGDPRAVKPIIRAWRADWAPGSRFNVEIALCLISDPAAVEPLIEALRGEGVSEYKRWLAAKALGRRGNTKAVGPLIEALQDEDEDLRLKAARSLGDIGDARAVGPLIEAIKDDIVRTGGCIGKLAAVATGALGDIGDESAVPALTELLRRAERTSLEDKVRYALNDIERKQSGGG